MTHLEDFQPSAAVRGILPDRVVMVVSIQWFGSEALELTYKTASGRVANEPLYRHDESHLEIVEHGRPWSFDGDGHLVLPLLGQVAWTDDKTTLYVAARDQFLDEQSRHDGLARTWVIGEQKAQRLTWEHGLIDGRDLVR